MIQHTFISCLHFGGQNVFRRFAMNVDSLFLSLLLRSSHHQKVNSYGTGDKNMCPCYPQASVGMISIITYYMKTAVGQRSNSLQKDVDDESFDAKEKN